MDDEEASINLERSSLDTLANINEDVTIASEFSTDSRNIKSESIFSSLRPSLDGISNGNGFGILRSISGNDDASFDGSGDTLGPNSIHDLTSALDAALIKSNRALKASVRINGGANIISNLTKPSTKDIPPIHLESLSDKVSDTAFTKALLNISKDEIRSFEQSYGGLTTDVLLSHSRAYESDETTVARNPESENPIPEVFEDEDFRLDDPRVFRKVMDGSHLFKDLNSADASRLSHNSEVQDKLSSYLDRIEVQLIQEIAKTSENFFNTLGDIEGIKTESRSCVSRFSEIKKKLDLLETSQAQKGLEILNLIDERRNVNHLESTLMQIKAVQDAFTRARRHCDKKQSLECLNWIAISENLIRGVEHEDYNDPETISNYPKFDYPMVNLRDLPAFTSLRSESKNLKSICSKTYSSEFLDLLITDLREHCQSVSTRDTMNRIVATVDRSKKYDASSRIKSYNEVSSDFKASLQVFIRNLAKFGCIVDAYAQYQSSIISEIKGIIRAGLPKFNQPNTGVMDNLEGSTPISESATPVPTSEESKLGQSSNTLSESIKRLENKAFNSMMRNIYANLSECFRRLTAHQKILLDLSLTSLSPDSSQHLDVMSLDISVAINKAIEITQIRLVKIFNVRSEQLADSSISDYLYMYSNSAAYLSECELINPGYNVSGPGSSLNEWVKNHVEYFIHKFHSNSVKHLATICGTETWREFSGASMKHTQDLIGFVSRYAEFVETGSGFNGDEWRTNLLDIYETDSVSEGHPSAGDESLDELTKLTIGKESYFVPQIIVEVVQCIVGYLQLVVIFNNKKNSLLQNMLTYLKVLNSRVSQAILNAGATRTAGLKHITTKHLALCIQTIDFLVSFSSKLEAIFPDSQPENDQTKDVGETATFSKTINNFRDHKNELFTKLVSIMRDRTLTHCKSIVGLNLNEPLKSPQQCHQYMEVLVKESLTVAKVLGKYLHPDDTQAIMGRIFDNYEKLLIRCYCTELPKLKDLSEKHSLLKDIDYFRVRLGDVVGYGESGQHVWESVNDLVTEEDAEMEVKMRSSDEASTQTKPDTLQNENKIQETTENKVVLSTEEIAKDGVKSGENSDDTLASDMDSKKPLESKDSNDSKPVESKSEVHRDDQAKDQTEDLPDDKANLDSNMEPEAKSHTAPTSESTGSEAVEKAQGAVSEKDE